MVVLYWFCILFFFSSRRRHTRCALVTGVQTCALPIYRASGRSPRAHAAVPPRPRVRERAAGGVARFLRRLDGDGRVGRIGNRTAMEHRIGGIRTGGGAGGRAGTRGERKSVV